LKRGAHRRHALVFDGAQEVEPLLAVLRTAPHEVHGGKVGRAVLDVLVCGARHGGGVCACVRENVTSA
jgi:hypothetical protein